MASENVDDWDEALPTSSTVEEEEEEEPSEEIRKKKDLEKLQMYVNEMTYRPKLPPIAKQRTESLAKPHRKFLIGMYEEVGQALEPKQRKQRVKMMTGKYTAITTEHLEQIMKHQSQKERKKENFLKRKQEVYYEMLTKLERQFREQYQNVLVKKFATFIAKLATTMRIPPQLIEPYSRMQRGIFCNILMALGIQPTNQAAIFYSSPEAIEFEVCHKLAHALLSLIIKALDTASTKCPEDLNPLETSFEMDNYIKDRLMCAAEKKILNARALNNGKDVLKKCEKSPRCK